MNRLINFLKRPPQIRFYKKFLGKKFLGILFSGERVYRYVHDEPKNKLGRVFDGLLKERKLFFLGVAIALCVTSLDLYSKKLIFNFLDNLAVYESNPRPEMDITSFFRLVKVWNRGVSFGMFNDLVGGKYIILAVNLTISSVLFIWLYRNKLIYIMIAIALIIGGALGNIIDRINNDAVADFLDFYLGQYHWPAFNLADSCVFIGVMLLVLENFFIKKTSTNEK